ncbi:MAG TPA: MiaB/RimO family radical SAM methylthiotransferase [Anaeromyxobacteraceae bacterium]|nr:MiaB/RimO family radical SAM methylthiotransferase [Anaeromyxobacteraceae bacterium]
MRRVGLASLGCRVNRADVDALAAELAGRFQVVEEGEPADLWVVSTCTVTADAESASRRAIRRLARKHPDARIVAAGCHAQRAPESLARLPGVVAVVGARSQTALPDLLRRLDEGEAPAAALEAAQRGAPRWTAPPLDLVRRTRPVLKIQDGCDACCAYCAAPDARGPARSLPFDEALSCLAALGRRHAEVVLSGVRLGAFGQDLQPRRSLARLVAAAAERRLVRRLRLTSVEPLELPFELLEFDSAASLLCEHFHLPLQSGSERTLRAMRRPYRPGQFAEVVTRIARAVPGACIGTDVIAGFPGETEADHRETVRLVEALPLAYLHVFPFSARPRTEAAALPGPVPAAVARARARELLALSDRHWRRYLAHQVGRDLEVVVERVEGGIATGTSREFVTVRWPLVSDRRGSLVRVRVEVADGDACFGVRSVTFRGRLPP